MRRAKACLARFRMQQLCPLVAARSPSKPSFTHQSIHRLVDPFSLSLSNAQPPQGMNELYAPLYWLYRTDPCDPPGAEAAEADAFFCFCDLMSEFRDHFCQQLVRQNRCGGGRGRGGRSGRSWLEVCVSTTFDFVLRSLGYLSGSAYTSQQAIAWDLSDALALRCCGGHMWPDICGAGSAGYRGWCLPASPPRHPTLPASLPLPIPHLPSALPLHHPCCRTTARWAFVPRWRGSAVRCGQLTRSCGSTWRGLSASTRSSMLLGDRVQRAQCEGGCGACAGRWRMMGCGDVGGSRAGHGVV